MYAFSEIEELKGTDYDAKFEDLGELNSIIEKGLYQPNYLLSHLQNIRRSLKTGEDIEDILFDKNHFSQTIKRIISENKSTIDAILEFVEVKTKDIKSEMDLVFAHIEREYDDFGESLEAVTTEGATLLCMVQIPSGQGSERWESFSYTLTTPMYSLSNLEKLTEIYSLMQEYKNTFYLNIDYVETDKKYQKQEIIPEVEGAHRMNIENSLVASELKRLESSFNPKEHDIYDIAKIISNCQELVDAGNPAGVFDPVKDFLYFEIFELLNGKKVKLGDLVYFFAKKFEVEPEFLFRQFGIEAKNYLEQMIQREFFEFSQQIVHTTDDGVIKYIEKAGEEEMDGGMMDEDDIFESYLSLLDGGQDFEINRRMQTFLPGKDSVTGTLEPLNYLTGGVERFTYPFNTKTNFDKIRRLNARKQANKRDRYWEFVASVKPIPKPTFH